MAIRAADTDDKAGAAILRRDFTRLEANIELLVGALDDEIQLRIPRRLFGHQRLDVGKAGNLVAIDAQDAVTDLEPGRGGRHAVADTADDRIQPGCLQAEANAIEQLGFRHLRGQLAEGQHARGLGTGGGTYLDGGIVAADGVFAELLNGLAPRINGRAVDCGDAVTGLDAGFGSNAAGGVDDGQEIRLADDKHQPEREQGEDDVESRAGGGNRHALANRLAVVGLVELFRGDLALALVEHLHVTAQRNRRHGELGAMPVPAHPQRLAETDRKAQHLHPAQAGDDEMAELMEGDQQAEGDQQPPHGSEKLAHCNISIIIPPSRQ